MKQGAVLVSGLLLVNTLLPKIAFTAEWERNAGVALSSYYTDNVCLSNEELEGRGAATVTPNLQITGQGARANLSLNAAATYDSLADSSLECETGQNRQLTNREAFIPSLRYLGDLELIDDWLTLESDAFIGRNPIDPFALGNIDRFNGRDNVNITYQYGAGATVQRRLFDSADILLRYYHNEQQNAVNLFGDSSEDRGEFDLGTERGGNRVSVGIAGRYSEVAFDESALGPAFDNTLSSAEARAAFQINSSWQINALVGEEWNDFSSAGRDIEGSYWDFGVLWSPNQRVEIALGTGERFFGTTPRGSVSYRHRRSQISVDYRRTLTFPRNLRAPGQDANNPFGPDFGQLPGNPLTVNGEPTFIGNTPIINERLNVRYQFTARRTTITISAADSRQLRLEDFGEANFTNLGVTFNRSLSSSLSGNFRLNWNETNGQGNNIGFFGQDAEDWRAGFGLSRRLGSSTTISLNYDYTRRESDGNLAFNAFNQFEENRMTISLQHQF